MALEKHMLQTHSLFEKAGEVFEGVAKLKQRIAELKAERDAFEKSFNEMTEAYLNLEKENKELKDKSRHYLMMAAIIESYKKENEDLKNELFAVKTDAAMATRWRKVSEELPEEYTDVLFVDSDGTYYLGDMWIIPTDGENPAEQYWSGKGEPRCKNPKYWLPLPKAPEGK